MFASAFLISLPFLTMALVHVAVERQTALQPVRESLTSPIETAFRYAGWPGRQNKKRAAPMERP